jgi:hypothetical protein
MGPIRRVIDDAPESIPIPEEFRHRRIELIIWPLGDDAEPSVRVPAYQKRSVSDIVIPPREQRHDR